MFSSVTPCGPESLQSNGDTYSEKDKQDSFHRNFTAQQERGTKIAMEVIESESVASI